MAKNKTVLLLICLLFELFLCACNGGGGDTPKTGVSKNADGSLTLTLPIGNEYAQVGVERRPVSELASYSIVRGDMASDNEIEAAKQINKLFDDLGTDLALTTDWVKRNEAVPEDTNEILIGATNRAESKVSDLRVHDFVINADDRRIAIYGGSADATLRAAGLFEEYFVEKDTKTVLVPTGELRFTDTYVCDTLTLNGTPLWEYGITGKETAVGILSEFCVSATGHTSANAKKAERKIVFKEGTPDGLCSVDVTDTEITVTGGKGDASLAARYLLSMILSGGNIRQDGSSQNAELTLKASVLTEDDIKGIAPIELYVSPDGNDAGAGTKDAPLATPAAAKNMVRRLLRETLAPVTVYFRGGDYELTEGLVFDEGDSGMVSAPVTYRAYENEAVNFYGGIRVDPKLVKKAEDKEIVDRVLDKTAAEKLMQIDLSSVVDVIPDYYSFGHTDNHANLPFEIYVGDKALDRSRYPNDVPGAGYLRNTGITVNADGTKTMSYDAETAKHISLWSDHAKDDLYLFGFLSWDWMNEAYDATDLDTQNAAVTLKGGLNSYYDSIKEGTRFYFFNLPEEIDVPGESFIDHEARIVYFYPTDDFSAEDIVIGTLTDSMMTFNGTKHIVIENINFLYTRGNALNVSGTDDFILKNCDIMHTSSNAASLDGSHITVSDCHVFDTASGGFSFTGGDRTNLISGDSVVENCEIHAINRTQTTYCPGVLANSLGLVIRNNKMYDSVHLMIGIGSNDILIENNEIFNCVKESADMGAIYYGRNPSVMGVVIRNNYFHDMGNDYGGTGQFSIYIDDGNMGADIYGNLFYRAAGTQYNGQDGQAAIMHHGTQFSHIHDNIFIDTAVGLRYAHWTTDESRNIQDNWFLWLYDRVRNDGNSVYGKCQSVNFDSEIWHERYDGTIWGNLYTYINEDLIAKYKDMPDEELKVLARELGPFESNEIDNNIYVNVPSPRTQGACNMHDNYISDDTSIFRDYAGGDFSLTEEGLAKVQAEAPAFKAFSIDSVGVGKR